jgi:hypothetical protein
MNIREAALCDVLQCTAAHNPVDWILGADVRRRYGCVPGRA